MSLNRTNAWRLAPRILFFYAIVHSSTIISSFQSNKSIKLSFLTHTNLKTPYSSPVIRGYTEIVVPSKHTEGCSVLYSSFKPSYLDKFNHTNSSKRSLLGRFWNYIKSYLSNKLSSVKLYKIPGRSRLLTLYGRNFNQHLKESPLGSISLFDFFANPPGGSNESMVMDMFDKKLSHDCPYMHLVRTGPYEIINFFLRVAPNMVKDAISLTVSTMIGSFYKYSAETTMITTKDRLASLILHLQVTGYIYCNAEHRYRLSRLYGASNKKEQLAPSSEAKEALDKKVTGSIVGEQMAEISPGDELLNYVKRLPRSYVNYVFDNMNPNIVEAMRLSTDRTIKLLTDSVVNPSYADANDQNKQIIQQTGTFAIQLCFWKLALGYCMRYMETNVELGRSLHAQ
ncbi:hypothetical protein MACK_000161 [Theileria orientalis]|uniref:Uncharacterized protein n=1 Tax=Theileria orientalis TaxID=68886 RepID=A0A976MB04_THEOR|nr:hypothetical protein MACK_000161 [Theileria orientalis]